MTDGCGSEECYKGIFPDVFHAIQSELNYTYTIVTTNNGGGTRLENGTWIGQIGFSWLNENAFRIFVKIIHYTRFKTS